MPIRNFHKFFLLLLFLCNQKLSAQEKPCEVGPDALKGTYTGNCINGKAHGEGKASGTDVFEGTFKNGYPDGYGTYIWADKNQFTGNFKKGRMDGKGELFMKTPSGKDTTIRGFWKKDKYIGEYEKQFVISAQTSRINNIDCRLSNKGGETILITVHQKVASNVAYIREISTMTGSFYQSNKQILTNSSVTRIQQVTFPFRAIFYMSNGENTEILFNEKGDYDVYIDMQ